SQPALNYISRRLAVAPAEAYGVATFYALFATNPRPPVVAHVCDDIACRLAGADETCAALERTLGPAGTADPDGRVGWLRSPCLGLCERAPAALITSAGEEARVASAAPVDAAGIVARLDGGGTPRRPDLIPQAGDPSLHLLRRVGVVDPSSLDDYRANGGYSALVGAPHSRLVASGRPSPDNWHSRTIWSATRTSRSPARSRTASCSKATRSRS